MEGEGEGVSKFKNGNDDKEHVCMDEGDGSLMVGEGMGGDCDENSDNGKTIQT